MMVHRKPVNADPSERMTAMQPDCTVKVLIVDDESINLRIMDMMLRDLDVTLYQALSGQEALQLVQEHDFTVIVLDLHMPGLDGFETARLIREQPRSQDTPLIFCTATYKEKTESLKGYALGAVDFLIKPLTSAVVRSKIQVFAD